MADLAAAQARVAALEAQLAGGAGAIVVAAAPVKLPTFWPQEPRAWFAQVDSQFHTKNVTNDATKYHHLVSALDAKTVVRVLDLLENPPVNNKYDSLKARLLGTLSLTRRDRARKIMELGSLGDELAVERLDKIRALRGQETNDIFLEEIFLRQLPDSVRTVMANVDMADLDAFAKAADNHILAARDVHSLSAIRPGPSKQSDDLCNNHKRFGKKTWNCQLPETCKMARIITPRPARPKNEPEPRN